jgi:hypothetical protein
VAYCPCGVSSTSQFLYKEFLDNLFNRGEFCLGRAVFAAKCSVIARYPTNDYLYGPAVLWTLLGDPALRVKHRIASAIEDNLKPDDHSRLTTPYSLTVFPSPCDASTTIRLSDPRLTRHSLSVFNASGRLILSQPVRTSSFVLGTSSLRAGFYVARCASVIGSASAQFLVLHR